MDGGWENVFLLPGDDLTVHLYREARLAENDGEARDQVRVSIYTVCNSIKSHNTDVICP